MKDVVITVFTDPMMGLSYESEPIFRKLETHFGEQLKIRYVMGGLVRDVYAFTDPADLQYGKEVALARYLKRLATIYKSEQSIAGLPIHMEGFCLFDREHTSSIPLCLAYKAAQLSKKSKADLFLYRLRYATVYETRPTTHFDEILRVVRQVGIEPSDFTAHYFGDAEQALQKDLDFFDSLGVNTLPAYLIEYEGQSLLINRLIDYEYFVEVIKHISAGKVRPHAPQISPVQFVKMHPLISLIELQAAFPTEDINQAITSDKNISINKEFIHYEDNIR